MIRTSAFFGPWERANFVCQVLSSLEAGRAVKLEEGIVSPTYVPGLVRETLDFLVDDERGIWHLVSQGMTSWSKLAERVAAEAGLSWRTGPRAAPGAARMTALSSERGLIMPSYQSAVSPMSGKLPSRGKRPWLKERRFTPAPTAAQRRGTFP